MAEMEVVVITEEVNEVVMVILIVGINTIISNKDILEIFLLILNPLTVIQ